MMDRSPALFANRDGILLSSIDCIVGGVKKRNSGRRKNVYHIPNRICWGGFATILRAIGGVSAARCRLEVHH